MKPASYAAVLALTVVVGCAAVLGGRVAGQGGQAFWSAAVTVTEKPHTTEAAIPTVPLQPVSLQKDDDLRPILPPEIYALPGQRFSLYYDGIITAHDPDDYIIEVSSPTLHGVADRRYWWVEPSTAEIGRHSLTIRVKSLAKQELLAEATTSLVVTSRPKPDTPVNVLIVGASNTQQNVFPNALWSQLNRDNPGKFVFVGSQPLKANYPFYWPALPQVLHEGYGGWTWQLFASHYMPGKEDLYKVPRSPFVFLEDGKPTLNVGRYLDEKGLRGKLGAVIFDLGINDTFAINPDVPADVEANLAATMSWADKLIEQFRTAAPETKLIVGIPAPFTRSEPVFRAAYGALNGDLGNPWRHRRIVLAMARRMNEHFAGKDPAIFVAPLYASLDVIDGYWQINPGHPNELGGKQMAETFRAVLYKSLQP